MEENDPLEGIPAGPAGIPAGPAGKGENAPKMVILEKMREKWQKIKLMKKSDKVLIKIIKKLKNIGKIEKWWILGHF